MEIEKNQCYNSDISTVSIDVEAEKEKRLDFISAAIKERDEHLKNYLSETEELVAQKEQLVAIAQKYLLEEKEHLLEEG